MVLWLSKLKDRKELKRIICLVDPDGEAMATAVAQAAGLYLRRCQSCGEQSYLRQGVCLFPSCKESYLSLSAPEVGKRLQSWGVQQETPKLIQHSWNPKG